ncbi:peptidoglycan-binding protein LysM [Pseudomonas sp. PCH199]|uniref:FimV/HubP family polar landmark protein n=1 Tax=unclassified Pseudomonas TaxID=196821 RepID=UPI000BC56B1B|nr:MULTISPECIES: FimV/HubP family polar landmark protein [unclassified Pseudomonas]MCW8276733.1 peptidoglycan-binding protein LysM [Pseudomonas sp. PCH199]PAM83159.1 peptidoglycan-binding protein LysM [Pseudomonas sp. ERMR1:02]
MLESRLIVVRCCARWLLAGAAVTWSAWAPALGLGEITLHSALNQPLRADIALVDVAGLEEGELSVSLATADEFSRAGVERAFFLNDLKFTPVLRGNRSLIQVASNKPVNEPFLNFLVQLNQPNGRLLREYTVLIDPPGAPGIVPASDEPLASRPSSAFASVQPVVTPASAPKEPQAKPAAALAPDPLAEQLAASVLQNQQLQATIDELNAKLQGQDEQIAGDKTQVAELQTRMAELKQAPAEPVAPVAVASAPVVVEEHGTNWLMIGGLLLLMALVLLAVLVRRQRQQEQATLIPADGQPPRHEPLLSNMAEPVAHVCAVQPTLAHHEVTPANDVLEAVAICLTYGRYTEANSLLREAMGENHPKLGPVAGGSVATSMVSSMATSPEPLPADEFQLNLDDLSMDTSWDLGPMEDPLVSDRTLSEPVLPETEIEWEIEPASQAQDDSFLDEFSESGPSLELEPLSLETPEPSNAGKLEQAQTCIDDGDLDSAIELLNQLLKDADEPFKQTARSLLGAIR